MPFNGIRLFGTKKPRGFRYKPRNQRAEEEEARQRNIHFTRMAARGPSSKRSLIYLIILAIVVTYMIIYLKNLTVKTDRHFKVESIKIEEVEE